MSKLQILIDGNAVGHAAHNMDPLTNTSGDQVQAVIGFLGTIAATKKEFPDSNVIVLWDGRSFRHDWLPTYKEGRDPDLSTFDISKPMSSAEEKRFIAAKKKAYSRAAYNKQGPWIKEAVACLGIPQMTCGNYEADDLAALFTDKYIAMGHPVRLITSDGDWMQLIQPRVVWKQSRSPYTFVNCQNFHDKAKVAEVTGFPDAKTFLEAKLLHGDSGDNIKGFGGFGTVAIRQFFETFDNLETYFDLSMGQIEATYKTAYGKKLPKHFIELREAGMFCEKLETARKLMDLRTPHRPAPERIVTERGSFDKPTLLKLAKQLDLYRLASDLDRFMETFEG